MARQSPNRRVALRPRPPAPTHPPASPRLHPPAATAHDARVFPARRTLTFNASPGSTPNFPRNARVETVRGRAARALAESAHPHVAAAAAVTADPQRACRPRRLAGSVRKPSERLHARPAQRPRPQSTSAATARDHRERPCPRYRSPRPPLAPIQTHIRLPHAHVAYHSRTPSPAHLQGLVPAAPLHSPSQPATRSRRRTHTPPCVLASTAASKYCQPVIRTRTYPT